MNLREIFKSVIIFFALLLSATALAGLPVVERIDFLSDNGEEVSLDIESLKTLVGETFNSQNLLADVSTLKDQYPQYQNIITSIDGINGDYEKIAVIFEFQLKRFIRSLRLMAEGNLEIPLDLREKLRLQRHNEFNANDLERDKQTISEYFIRRGFPKVQVLSELQNYGNNEELEVTLTIKANTNKLEIKKLKIHGNDSFETIDLRRKMKAKPRGFFLARHTVFSHFQLQEDIKKLKEFYTDEGFLDIDIKYDYNYDEQGSTTINLYITEGSRYKVKEYRIYHNGLYSEGKIRKLLRNKSTDRYNDKDVRAVLQRFREFYGKNGHAQVEVRSFYDSVNEEVIIKVIEGPIFTVEKVLVEGNEKMETKTILLDSKIEEGENFNAETIKKTIEKMRATGYYEDVRIDFDQTGEEKGNLIILVKEARTQTITFGAGTGTNGLMGELSFSDRNFLNSGNSISLHLKKMAEMTKIGLVYKDPHLFDSDYALRFATSFIDENQEDFHQRKVGATLMIEKKITENLKVGVGTRIEFLNLSEIDEEIRLADHHADGKDRILGMMGTLFYKTETKDEAGDIKDGIKVSMALLPSFADQGAYIKTFSTVIGTKSLWENENGVAHTVSGRLTVGYASENAPFHEKFYAGGVGTLRGFERNSLKSDDGDGGNLLLSASAGYSFPIWEDKVKGVVFLEAASVGDGLSDLGNVRTVGGIGVKANLMDTFLGSMIEAGVAIPLRKEEGDELKPFYFIFGDYDPAYDL